MLIRKRRNEFLVDSGESGEVLNKDSKVFALLFQISPQLRKNGLCIFTGNIGTALDDLPCKTVEIVHKLSNFKLIAFQRDRKKGGLGIALFYYSADNSRNIKIFFCENRGILKNLIAWGSDDIIASGYSAAFTQQVFTHTAVSEITGDITASDSLVGFTGYIVSYSRNVGIQNFRLERIFIFGIGGDHKLTELLCNIGIFDCPLL